MKKLFLLTVIALCGLAFYSCSSNSTPTEVVEKALKCIKAKDYKGYVDLIKFKDNESPEEIEKGKEQLQELIAGKMNEQIEKKEGFKDFKILEEIIDGNKATVKYQIIWGNGETEDEKIQLIQDDKGKWLIDLNK